MVCTSEKTYRRKSSSNSHEPDRKNLAVHVSLSSIFTMTRNRPRSAASKEPEAPNFGGQFLLRLPGSRSALSGLPPRRAVSAVVSDRPGSSRVPPSCQHPF